MAIIVTHPIESMFSSIVCGCSVSDFGIAVKVLSVAKSLNPAMRHNKQVQVQTGESQNTEYSTTFVFNRFIVLYTYL